MFRKNIRLTFKGDFREKAVTHDIVKPGTILVKQTELNYLPGLNVGVGPRGILYAKVKGKVVVTREKTNLVPDNHLVLINYKNSLPKYGKYYHVIPEPQEYKFNLVDSL